MGKPTGFLDYERKIQKQKHHFRESVIFMSLKLHCLQKNSRNRADAAWTAACRSARTAACSQA